MSRPTVLIALADAIPVLQQQPYLRESQAFTETELAVALNAIRELLPPVIAIERNFAGTLPGQGFIKRIKTDPTLRRCEIETVGIRRARDESSWPGWSRS